MHRSGRFSANTAPGPQAKWQTAKHYSLDVNICEKKWRYCWKLNIKKCILTGLLAKVMKVKFWKSLIKSPSWLGFISSKTSKRGYQFLFSFHNTVILPAQGLMVTPYLILTLQYDPIVCSFPSLSSVKLVLPLRLVSLCILNNSVLEFICILNSHYIIGVCMSLWGCIWLHLHFEVFSMVCLQEEWNLRVLAVGLQPAWKASDSILHVNHIHSRCKPNSRHR